MPTRRHRRPIEQAHRSLQNARESLTKTNITTHTLELAEDDTNEAISNIRTAIESGAYNTTQTIIMESAHSAALQAAARIDAVQEDLEQTYLAHEASPAPQHVQEILRKAASEAQRMVADAIAIMDAGELGTTQRSQLHQALRPVNIAAALFCIPLIIALAIFETRALSIAAMASALVAMTAIIAHGVYKWDTMGQRGLDRHMMATLPCIIIMTAAIFALGAGPRLTTLTALTMSIAAGSFWAIMRTAR